MKYFIAIQNGHVNSLKFNMVYLSLIDQDKDFIPSKFFPEKSIY